MNPDGTMSFEEDEKPVLEPIDFTYIKKDIDNELIEECEILSKNNNQTYFIFDTNISNRIESNDNLSIERLRNEKLSLLLGELDFKIGTEEDFKGLPSRFSYYDTETKIIDRYEKYNYVVKYLIGIGFTPGITNFGPEFEQSYLIELNSEKFICRLQPNLFLKIIYQDSDFITTIYNEFFNKEKIFETMKAVASSSFIRDLKLSQILE